MASVTLDELRASGVYKSTDKTLKIEMGDKPLSVGGHTFELQVTDDSQNISAPTQILVIVVDDQAPTAVAMLRDENGVVPPDNRIGFGRPFILDGSRSVDSGGGRIIEYAWRLLD